MADIVPQKRSWCRRPRALGEKSRGQGVAELRGRLELLQGENAMTTNLLLKMMKRSRGTTALAAASFVAGMIASVNAARAQACRSWSCPCPARAYRLAAAMVWA